jgi:hypothetical protein
MSDPESLRHEFLWRQLLYGILLPMALMDVTHVGALRRGLHDVIIAAGIGMLGLIALALYVLFGVFFLGLTI